MAVTAGLLATAAPAGAVSDGYWDYRSLSVSGTYQPLVGSFGGDGADDIFWYAPGTTADSLWLGQAASRGASAFTRKPMAVSGSFKPTVGDFAGSDLDDIFWYAPGAGKDYLWINKGDGTFTSKAYTMGGNFTLHRMLDYRADHKDDLFVHCVNCSATSYEWHFSDSGSGNYTSRQMGGIGGKRPVIGDWNGDGIEDLFLHGPGNQNPDLRWSMTDDGTWEQKVYSISGTYEPVVVYQVPNDAILFWGGERGPEAYWWSDGTNFANKAVRSVTGSGRVTPFPLGAAVVSGPYVYDALFIGTESAGEFYDLAQTGHEKANEVPIIGDFNDDGWYDIVWYKAGPGTDEVWYLEPQTADRAALRGLQVGPRRDAEPSAEAATLDGTSAP
ncbi:MAG: hypothetical protein JWO77_2077 [Ilumatobacteraceae bacterium]|nr:hypothetical protein [Ilumatobacteraceae bacterium]